MTSDAQAVRGPSFTKRQSGGVGKPSFADEALSNGPEALRHSGQALHGGDIATERGLPSSYAVRFSIGAKLAPRSTWIASGLWFM